MSDNDFTSPKGEEEVHLLDYLIVLAKHSRMIIYTSALLTLLTLGYLLTKPNQYTAKATILPPQQNVTLSEQLLDSLAVSGSSWSSAGMGGVASLLSFKSLGDLYVGLLKGTTISNRTIDQFDLKEAYGETSLEASRKKLYRRVDIQTGKEGC